MLKTEKIYKSFEEKEILKGVDFEVKKGEKVIIIGPSGSGKSTMLRCLNLLEKTDKGKIIFNGKEINNKTNVDQFRQKVGMVFQQFNLFPNLTVKENVMLAPVNLKKKTEEAAEKEAIKLLKKIKLLDKANQFPNQLSGGEKQRIAIIRALAMEPEILLFDEPTSALDPEMVEEVLNLMKEVANEGITMVIVTHEMEFAKEIGSKIVFMDNGQIIEQGDAIEIFEKPKTKRLKNFLEKVKKF